MKKIYKKIKNIVIFKLDTRKRVIMDKNILEKSKWKNKNSQYLFELQKFLDLADNIEDKEFRKVIIGQMLKCDKCVTNIAEKMFKSLKEQETYKVGK